MLLYVLATLTLSSTRKIGDLVEAWPQPLQAQLDDDPVTRHNSGTSYPTLSEISITVSLSKHAGRTGVCERYYIMATGSAD